MYLVPLLMLVVSAVGFCWLFQRKRTERVFQLLELWTPAVVSVSMILFVAVISLPLPLLLGIIALIALGSILVLFGSALRSFFYGMSGDNGK